MALRGQNLEKNLSSDTLDKNWRLGERDLAAL